MLLNILLNFRLVEKTWSDIHSCELVVIIIAVELILDRVTSQREKMLLKFFIFLILPVLIDILLIKVILLRGDKRCLNLFVPKIFPREVFEPGMLFNFCWTVFPKSVNRFPLNHLYSWFYLSPLTLFIKSAASIDQPLGISFFFICICLARI